MFVYEYNERQIKLRDILKSLNVTWRDGGEYIKTCLAIESLFDHYAKKDCDAKDAILTELADIITNGVANNVINPTAPQ